jgi:type VI protein secretion system component VasK
LRQAREYLKNIGGVDRIYNAILASSQKSVAKPKGLGEVAPNYAQVLRSQGGPAGFTIEGWNFVVNASKDQKSALLGDCVFADDEQIEASAKADTAPQASLATEIQRRYVQDYVRSWKDFLAGHSIVPYDNPRDAANKLRILSSSQSPLLGLFALTADQTNFATETKAPTAVEGLMKTVEKAASMVTQAKPDLRPSLTEAAIAQSFQPVHIVVPPKSERWVTEKNTPYVEALSRLGAALQAIGMSTDSASREAALQAAIPIKQGALEAAEKLAREFNRTDLAEVAERLLKQPIHLTDPFMIPAKPGEQPNGSLTQLCKAYGSTFEKYPFRKSSTQDATLEELTAWFAPMTGQIWKFRAEALAPFTEPENGHWKAKEGQGPQITPEMLRFLNRAQDIAATVYAKGPQPQFTYVLRPKLDSSFKSSTVELEVDGQLHQWNSIFQKEFTWPAAPGAKVVGAIFRIRSDNVAYAFNSHPGVWGVFKMMADAEPRGPKSALIEWKYSSVHDLIQPAPVRMEFPEFPNGVDIFQPDFFGGLRCPSQAVSAR